MGGTFIGQPGAACVAVLLRGDGNQSNYQPAMIGLTAANAGTIDFLGEERRIGMRVVNWNLVTTVVRSRPTAAVGEHPRIFVARGTHGLYGGQVAQPLPAGAGATGS